MEPNIDTWSFLHVSDMHIGSPRSYRFQPAWNANWQTARNQILQQEPDLLLIGGDMTRDGATHTYELEQAKADFDTFPFPWYAIPGNHEVGNKFVHGDPVTVQHAYLRRYNKVFGSSCWSFAHKNVQFTGLDAFLAGSGLPEEKAMWDWLDRLESLPNTRFHVCIVHPALFADHPLEPNWDRRTHRTAWYFCIDQPWRNRFMEAFKRTQVTHVISGHIHCRRKVEHDGIIFHFAPSTAFPQWGNRWSDGDDTLGMLAFNVSINGIRDTFIPLEKTSSLQGYGPGGNPPLQGRDYSIAWEQL
jgi:hypothetical protein